MYISGGGGGKFGGRKQGHPNSRSKSSEPAGVDEADIPGTETLGFAPRPSDILLSFQKGSSQLSLSGNTG